MLTYEPQLAIHAVPVAECDWSAASSELSTGVHSFRPSMDSRWDDFVERHPQASVFHSSSWLNALQRTYGYEDVAYTTSSARQDLTNAVVFCRINSWLTGRRLVSLPFSDHCQPLVANEDQESLISDIVTRELSQSNLNYVELRPLEYIPVRTRCKQTEIGYAFHQLDLTPDLSTLWNGFHKSSIQRKIRRAEREKLRYREGSSEILLDDFYSLFQQTRRRHNVPPQPRNWFRNLVACFGPALKIRVAYQDARPVSAMITIRHKSTLVYKYGCSDAKFNNLGAMPFLFWQAIQDAKSAGLRLFDFGRTDAHQQGLITFKNRWGATQSVLTYSRYSVSGKSTHSFDLPTQKWKVRAAEHLLPYLPSSAFTKIGQLLYRHIG